ncbi:MAG: hypothetical protein R6V85_02900 [Polyangia bacterium]
MTCVEGDYVQEDCDPQTQVCQDCECQDCVDIAFDIQTMQACAIDILAGYDMDGEGFINFYEDDYRVFAMDRWGDGHVIAHCDTTILDELIDSSNVLGYLEQVANPSVASFGDTYLCDPNTPNTPLPPERIALRSLGFSKKCNSRGRAADIYCEQRQYALTP